MEFKDYHKILGVDSEADSKVVTSFNISKCRLKVYLSFIPYTLIIIKEIPS